MENTLISMTDFVLEQKDYTVYEANSILNRVHKYANFLNQPLKLGMFVPCDEDGNVLIEPTEHNPIYWSKEYTEAKEKVLFKGFYQEFNATKTPTGGYLNMNLFNHNVEFLVGVQHIILTESALKQIYK